MIEIQHTDILNQSFTVPLKELSTRFLSNGFSVKGCVKIEFFLFQFNQYAHEPPSFDTPMTFSYLFCFYLIVFPKIEDFL